MSYADAVNEHRRLTILRLLERDPDYVINESLLSDGLAEYGFSPSRDRLRTELAWLAEQGFVELREAMGVQVVTLTSRGVDVALGRTVVPGVRRPSPRS